MSGALHVSVVVVARNEEAKIEQCIGSLAGQNYPAEAFEIILVDDGSSDRTVELALMAFPRLRVFSNPSRSISSNRNRGWRAARHPFVAYLDADCIAPPEWLKTLTTAMARLDVAAVGSANEPPSGETTFYDALAIMLNTTVGSRGSVQGMRFPTEREVPHLPGLNVLYRRDALDLVRGFDERFALVGEDEDLSRRLRALGFRLVYVPGATVIHRQRATYREWARNMVTYGRGRSWLVRRHPAAFEPALLGPPLLPLLLPAYLPTIAAVSAVECIRSGRPMLTTHLTALYATTHFAYGLGEILGMTSPGDTEKSREEAWPKVGLIVLEDAGNKGDEAILLSVCARINAVRNTRPLPFHFYVIALGPSGLDVRPIPDDEEAVSRFAQDVFRARPDARTVGAGAVKDTATLLHVLATFRALLICGGQWLHDLRPAYHAIISSILGLGRRLGVSVGTLCIGAGPLRSTWSRKAVGAAFGPRAFVSVRDSASVKLLESSGVRNPLLGADPAVGLPTADSAPVEIRPGTVGIVPCAWGRFENVYARNADEILKVKREFSSVIHDLGQRGHDILLIPTMNPEDQAFADEIAESCRDFPRPPSVLRTDELSPQGIQAVIRELSLLVSMRLHPVIFAMNVATPFVAINYASKVREFCARTGLDEFLVEMNEPGWGEAVLARVGAIQRDPERVRRALRDAHGVLVAALEPTYDALWRWLERPPHAGQVSSRAAFRSAR